MLARHIGLLSLSLPDRNPGLAVGVALVFRPGADQAIVAVLLKHVRRPTRHTAHRENRREEVDRDAQRNNTSMPNRNRHSDLNPLIDFTVSSIRLEADRVFSWPVRFPSSSESHAEMRSARIFRSIDTMSESWNFDLPRESVLDALPRLRLRRPGLVTT